MSLQDEILPEPLEVLERDLVERFLGEAEEHPGDVTVLLHRARAPFLRLEHPLEPSDQLENVELDRRRRPRRPGESRVEARERDAGPARKLPSRVVAGIRLIIVCAQWNDSGTVPAAPCLNSRDRCVLPCAAPRARPRPSSTSRTGALTCAPRTLESVEERVRREMHRQLPRFARGTVAVALSGGKDSGVALALSQRSLRRRPTVRLVAVSVDEGIAGYRAATLEAARALTGSLGVEHRASTAQEAIGTTTDRAAMELPGTVPCSFCGVWRRQLLNCAAREVGADALVLGFNLDDLSQTVLMNLVRGDLDRLVRMAPHRVRQPGLVPRVAPLALIPEREVYLYARLQGIPFDHGECPHAAGRLVTCSARSSGNSRRPSRAPASRSCGPTRSWSLDSFGRRASAPPPTAAGPVGSPPPVSSVVRASTLEIARTVSPSAGGFVTGADQRCPRATPASRSRNGSSWWARGSWGAASPPSAPSRAIR